MPKKFYAVRAGLNPGIYTTWDDCKKQVIGFSRAVYKGFDSLEAAQNFICNNESEGYTATQTEQKLPAKSDAVSLVAESACYNDTAFAYVDGSYDTSTKNFSCGVVFIHNGVQKSFAKKFDFCDASSMRNVAGEIEGATAAMKFCLDLGIKNLNLYYDYEGIAKWCLGQWKASREHTKAYKNFYNSVKDSLNVRFIKVKGHSGNMLNDLADSLAKSALGMRNEEFLTF